MPSESVVTIVVDLTLPKTMTWTRMEIRKFTCFTRAGIGLTKTGEKLKRSGYPMMSTRRKRRRNSDKRRGVFTKHVQEKKMDFEEMLTRFASASEKRRNETDAAIREQQVMMKE